MRAAVVLALLLAAEAAPAATILEREVEITIDGPSVVEKELLLVAVEEPNDVETWSEYRVLLDDHIHLVECRVEVLDLSGKVVEKVPGRRQKREDSAGEGLYASSWYHVVLVPHLAVGQRLRLEVTRRLNPYYRALSVLLTQDSPQASLSVRVRGGGRSVRHYLQAPAGLVTLSESADGLEVTGHDLPAENRPEHCGDALSVQPRLEVVWEEGSEWRDVGRWYSVLSGAVRRGSPEVVTRAQRHVEGKATARQRLEALVELVKRQVRYEAVEIGVGGWVPAAAEEVLRRGWGDCKDKVELLSQLLAAVGIRSLPVLLRAGRQARIDPAFPSPGAFNHCILAVPADQIEVGTSDPVIDGLLLVDPTMDRGDVTWLSPYSQGQWALVVDGDRSRLLRIPTFYRDEARLVQVEGEVAEDGRLSGAAVLRLRGEPALHWVRDLDSLPPVRIEEAVRAELEGLLPGAALTQVRFSEIEGPVPAVHLEAHVELPRLARGEAAKRWLALPLHGMLPEPRVLERRAQPVVVAPGVSVTRWRLRLPATWCRISPLETSVENALGRLEAVARVEADGRLLVERTVEVREAWVTVDALPQLEALAVAEARSNRLRLRCEGP